jgi:hypothetical protein
VASVGVLVAFVAGVATRDTDDDEGSRVIVGADSDAPGPLPGLHEVPAPPDEVSLSGPYDLGPSPIWTGTELFAIGAVDDVGTVVSLAFDPTTRRWRELPAPPVAIGQGGPSVWTGEELIVCCGGAPESSAVAAYDPETDAWRTLPDAPVRGHAAAEWIGDHMIVVASNGAASFDPESEDWSALPCRASATSGATPACGRGMTCWSSSVRSPPACTPAASCSPTTPRRALGGPSAERATPHSPPLRCSTIVCSSAAASATT